MFRIEFKINGRTVHPNQIDNELEKAILQQVRDNIKKRVGSVRCKTHGQAAKIIATGRSIDKLKFEVSGCCEELVEQVKQRLS